MWAVVGAVAVFVVWLLWYIRPATRWKIRTLIDQSRRSYAKKEHSRALEQVNEARELALQYLGETSTVHEHVLVHLAGAYSALSDHDKAIEVLRLAERLAMRRNALATCIRLLHGIAEVQATAGRAALAIEALGAARELQKQKFSEASVQYGGACFTQARAIIRYANDSLALSSSQREELVAEAAKLSIEASGAFDSAHLAHEGDEYVEKILEAIEETGATRAIASPAPWPHAMLMRATSCVCVCVCAGGGANDLMALPGCVDAVATLRQHLRDHHEFFGDSTQQGSGGDGGAATSCSSEGASSS